MLSFYWAAHYWICILFNLINAFQGCIVVVVNFFSPTNRKVLQTVNMIEEVSIQDRENLTRNRGENNPFNSAEDTAASASHTVPSENVPQGENTNQTETSFSNVASNVPGPSSHHHRPEKTPETNLNMEPQPSTSTASNNANLQLTETFTYYNKTQTMGDDNIDSDDD